MAPINDSLPSHAPAGSLCREVSAPQKTFVSQGASWKAEYSRLSDEIKLRHYSPKTLKAYLHWVSHYQTFTRSRNPKTLSTADVKEFLTHLAVEPKVSASTQNQAFRGQIFKMGDKWGTKSGQKEDSKLNVCRMVPGTRLELVQPCDRGILSHFPQASQHPQYK